MLKTRTSYDGSRRFQDVRRLWREEAGRCAAVAGGWGFVIIIQKERP